MRHALHAAVIACLAVASAASASGAAPGGRVAATLYGGVLTKQDWHEILLTPWDTELESGGLAVAGLSRRMNALQIGDFGTLAWEVEALLTRHWGAQSHWELALAPASTRWHAPGAPVSAAFSLGLSAASSIPEAERVTKGGSNAVMVYWALDLEVGLPPAPDWSVVGRLHHRSTGYGLFGDLGGGNALILGLRRRFRLNGGCRR